MYIITINNIQHEAIETWPEMTLSKATELNRVISKCPERLRELYDHRVKGDQEAVEKLCLSITPEEEIKQFPAFYGEVLKVLTDVPGDIIDLVTWKDKTWFYDNYCCGFVFGFLYLPNIERKNIKSFEFGGETFMLPVSKKILGTIRPMAEVTAEELTECADLEIYSRSLEGGRYECAANLISILCRPEGEAYNEDVCLKRAEEFKELPMDIVWEVFFCLMELSIISGQRSAISLMEAELEEHKQKQQPLRVVWKGMDGTPV